jgi:hypothetical protein
MPLTLGYVKTEAMLRLFTFNFARLTKNFQFRAVRSYGWQR